MTRTATTRSKDARDFNFLMLFTLYIVSPLILGLFQPGLRRLNGRLGRFAYDVSGQENSLFTQHILSRLGEVQLFFDARTNAGQ